MLKAKEISKYDHYYYWENLIHKEDPLWENAFQDLPLTPSSMFLYTVVMDQNKNFIKNRWVYYPDVYAVLGFIQYVYMPTALFTFLDEEAEGFNMPLATAEEVLFYHSSCIEHRSFINTMEEKLVLLKTFWHLEENECIQALKDFLSELTPMLSFLDTKIIYCRLFENPMEISDYILYGGEMEVELEVIEEEIGLKKQEWETICANIYLNPFMKRKFINVLNHRVGYLV